MDVVILIQPIRAKQLKVDAIRLELLNELRKQGRAIASDLRKTVDTWNDKPTFRDPDISLQYGNATVGIEPSGSAAAVQHFEWTDKGTRPHIIRPRRAKALRFRAGSKAKTKVRVIGSEPGWNKGPWRSAKAVSHPGTKARRFTQTVYARRLGPFEAAMRNAVARGAAKAY